MPVILCEQCEFWEILENEPDMGVCKRNAPSPKIGQDGGANIGPFSHRSVWPYARKEDGCGQGIYRMKKIPVADEQTVPPNPSDLFQTKIADAQKVTQDKDKFDGLVKAAKERVN